ncbi:hypothetical protein FQR65_LT15280 [Abscondita terminalis]|nr:hypothetical protein FQR65_LT15280 [Abscondita terminalis]
MTSKKVVFYEERNELRYMHSKASKCSPPQTTTLTAATTSLALTIHRWLYRNNKVHCHSRTRKLPPTQINLVSFFIVLFLVLGGVAGPDVGVIGASYYGKYQSRDPCQEESDNYEIISLSPGEESVHGDDGDDCIVNPFSPQEDLFEQGQQEVPTHVAVRPSSAETVRVQIQIEDLRAAPWFWAGSAGIVKTRCRDCTTVSRVIGPEMAFFDNLNVSTHLLPYVSASNLPVGEKIKIKSFSKIDGKFGEQVLVECGDFKTPLPQRFTSKFSLEDINRINEQIQLSKKNIYIVSKGAIGPTTNIEFIEK